MTMTFHGKYLLLMVLYWSGKHVNAKDPKLMVFLLDGFRWDYFETTNLTFPGFKKLFANGVKFDYTTLDFPTMSLPNYYTIMTGLHTESHGMIGNNMYDEQRDKYFLLSNASTQFDPVWWNDAEPIWLTAERQGKKAYMFYWMGCDVEIRGKRPTFCEPYFYVNGKYPGVTEMSNAIDTGIHLFKNNSADLVGMKMVCRQADACFRTKDKFMISIHASTGIYVETPDKYGHYFGPDSAQLIGKLKEIDDVIGQLVDKLSSEGLNDEVTVMVFSDHGMTHISPARSVNLTEYIDLTDLRAAEVEAGPLCSIWPKEDKTDKVLYDLNRAKNDSGHINIYTKNEIPEEWHYKNHRWVAPITVTADLGWFILHSYLKEFPASSNGPLKGYHGYDSKEPEMRGILIAAGPGIKKNINAPPVEAVDMYQLMCKALGITPSPHNGTWSHIENIFTPTSSADRHSFTIPMIIIFMIASYL